LPMSVAMRLAGSRLATSQTATFLPSVYARKRESCEISAATTGRLSSRGRPSSFPDFVFEHQEPAVSRRHGDQVARGAKARRAGVAKNGPRDRALLFSLSPIPPADGVVLADRQQLLAFFKKDEAHVAVLMAGLRKELLARREVPEAELVIVADGRQRLAVRRKRQATHVLAMSLQNAGQLAAVHIQEFDRFNRRWRRPPFCRRAKRRRGTPRGRAGPKRPVPFRLPYSIGVRSGLGSR